MIVIRPALDRNSGVLQWGVLALAALWLALLAVLAPKQQRVTVVAVAGVIVVAGIALRLGFLLLARIRVDDHSLRFAAKRVLRPPKVAVRVTQQRWLGLHFMQLTVVDAQQQRPLARIHGATWGNAAVRSARQALAEAWNLREPAD